jgi:hypothetical protein
LSKTEFTPSRISWISCSETPNTDCESYGGTASAADTRARRDRNATFIVDYGRSERQNPAGFGHPVGGGSLFAITGHQASPQGDYATHIASLSFLDPFEVFALSHQEDPTCVGDILRLASLILTQAILLGFLCSTFGED